MPHRHAQTSASQAPSDPTQARSFVRKHRSSPDSVPGPLTAGQWEERQRPVKRKFPGPPGASALLRIAFSREAYADLLAHAKGSSDREVCGVLIGLVCEDDSGLFLSVDSVIAGEKAREEDTHVTFTQETWNHIHETLKQRAPGESIVGWYHTHPGYGVSFSDMDAFVHTHFFPGATQAALVIDPLGGDTAIIVNTADGIAYLERFWVDGREHRLDGTVRTTDGKPVASGTAVASQQVEKRLDELDVRISQVLQGQDALSAAIARALTTLAVVVGFAVVFIIGFNVYRRMTDKLTPPEVQSFAPVPVQVGNRVVYLGVGVAQWEIPPELMAVHVAIAKEKEAARQSQEAATEDALAVEASGKQQNWFSNLFRKRTDADSPEAAAANSSEPGNSPVDATPLKAPEKQKKDENHD